MVWIKRILGLLGFYSKSIFNDEQLNRVKRLENALSNNPFVADIFSARFYQHEHLTFGSWSGELQFFIMI